MIAAIVRGLGVGPAEAIEMDLYLAALAMSGMTALNKRSIQATPATPGQKQTHGGPQGGMDVAGFRKFLSGPVG